MKTFPSPEPPYSAAESNTCVHEWVVYSTALSNVSLLVECVGCGACGAVGDPTAEEWHRAFRAPSHPYRWPHGERVALLPDE